MGKIITIIVVAVLVIWGIYYFVSGTPSSSNLNYSSSTPGTSSSTGTNTGSTSQGGTSTSVATSSKNIAMDIKNFAFGLTPLTVSVGTKITWTNQDTAPHTVTSVTGTELNSAKLAKGQSYSHTFTKAGTYDYYCTVHPNMKATVIVQ